MSSVKGGPAARSLHRKILSKAKGYYGARSRTVRTAKQAVEKAMQYATRDRKVRKRIPALQPANGYSHSRRRRRLPPTRPKGCRGATPAA